MGSEPFALLDITKFYGPATGGIRTYLQAKVAWSAGHPGLRHAVVVPGAADRLELRGGVRWHEVRGPRLPGTGLYRLLVAPRRISAILAAERPAVVELGSHFLVPWQVLRANRLVGARVAWYAHTDLVGLAGRRWVPGLPGAGGRRALAARYVRALGRRVDLVLAASEWQAAQLRRVGVPRVEVAPLGVDLERFHPRRRERLPAVRARFALPGAPYACYAGRLAREKELDVVLRAWPEVKRRTGIRLVLAGSGADAERLRRLPGGGAASWIPFEPDRDAMADLVAGAEFCVAPGPHETFGLAAAEATASGVPVLAVDRGAVGERVAASGTGATYRQGDAAGFVAAAAALAGAGQAARGQARAYAESALGWEGAFEGLLAVYRRLATG